MTVLAFFCGWCVAGALVCLTRDDDRALAVPLAALAVGFALSWAGVIA